MYNIDFCEGLDSNRLNMVVSTDYYDLWEAGKFLSNILNKCKSPIKIMHSKIMYDRHIFDRSIANYDIASYDEVLNILKERVEHVKELGLRRYEFLSEDVDGIVYIIGIKDFKEVKEEFLKLQRIGLVHLILVLGPNEEMPNRFKMYCSYQIEVNEDTVTYKRCN